jgi:hypothetical protein
VLDEVKLVGALDKLFDLGDQSSGIDAGINASLGPGGDPICDNENVGRSEDGVLASFPGLIRVGSSCPSSFELKPLRR